LSWSHLVRADAPRSSARVAIAPSLLACDFARLENEIKAVERGGAEFLHLDVMDGHFVDNITFGPVLVEAIDRIATLPLDTHLMIEHPDRYLNAFMDAGADILTIHIETSADAPRDLRAIRDRGRKSGLALNPDAAFAAVRDAVPGADLLLVMSVFPGFGGQSFIESTLRTVEDAARFREREGLAYAIEIDGGINPETARRAREAGVDILVAGTAIFRTPDYATAIRAIRGAVTP
jgi:ribulose-phosphate 3-epimerase